MEPVDYLIIAFLLFVIIVFGYVVYKINTEGAKCVISPLVYGVNQMEKYNSKEFICSCNFINAGASPLYIITKDNLTIKNNFG